MSNNNFIPQQTIAIIPAPPTKNKFLTFITALIPGAGQLYHGLMKKGVSIMILFYGIIAVASFLYMDEIAILLPIIWFYSFFEAVNRMGMPAEEIKLLKDEFVFSFLFENNNEKFAFIKKRNLQILIGAIILIVGAYAFLSGIVNTFDFFASERVRDIAFSILHSLPTVFIPLICIFFGVAIIKNSYGKNNDNSVAKPE